MDIKSVDLSRLPPSIKTKIKKKINRIIDTGDFVLGSQLQKFEQSFAGYIGVKYCVGVASGTDALLLSLSALGIGKDDEVIIPAMTFVATVSPILQLGAKPVLVDISAQSALIDVSKIESAITGKTKAIIPVHLYGNVCDMDKLNLIARKYNLDIIEDACQAHGSEYKGKKAGSFGTMGMFSFYPAKNLGAFGDAGAIVTSNSDLAKKLFLLRNHGQDKKYNHILLGQNSRLDTIQAAVLSEKLRFLDKWNQKRKKIADYYSFSLKDLPIKFININSDIMSNYHLFVILTEKRDILINFLKKKGISTGIHYPKPIHLQPFFEKENISSGLYPNAEILAENCLSLPMFPELTKNELLYIIKQIRLFFKIS